MIKIIPPQQFKTIPWKNGLGETTELAINQGGNLDDFDWRLSIASVVNDGVFSNFTGYCRNLVLIEGVGLSLTHDNIKTDSLNKLLDVARFSGGCETNGKLINGAIKDFNIITKTETVSADVQCYQESQQVMIKLAKNSLCFAYSLSDEMRIKTSNSENNLVPVGCLVKVFAQESELIEEKMTVAITGENMIIVQLEMISA